VCVCTFPERRGYIPYLKVSIWLIRISGWRASNSVPGEHWIIYSVPASPRTPCPVANSTTKRRGGSVRGSPSDLSDENACQEYRSTNTLFLFCLFLPVCGFGNYSWPDYLLVCAGYRGKIVRGEALRTQHHDFNIRYKNFHSDWNYACTPNRVNVFETGITLPGRSEVSLAATTPYRLQLCTELGISACTWSDQYCNYT
jgi:hypothetical protein